MGEGRKRNEACAQVVGQADSVRITDRGGNSPEVRVPGGLVVLEGQASNVDLAVRSVVASKLTATCGGATAPAQHNLSMVHVPVA